MNKYFIRTGSFVIDMSIINMFAQTLYKYIFGFYIHLSFNNLAHDIAVIFVLPHTYDLSSISLSSNML